MTPKHGGNTSEKELLNNLEKQLLADFGKPCWDKHYSKKNRGFNFNCPSCQVWMAYQILEDYLMYEDNSTQPVVKEGL